MNILSWTVDDWYWFCQIFSLILLGGTVVLGAGALLTGRILNKRQAGDIAALNSGTEELKQLNIEAQRVLESERTTRLKLESSLAPRRVVEWSGENFELLKRLSGTRALVDMPIGADIETRRAAAQIANVLRNAGWNISLEWIHDSVFEAETFDGVTVQWYDCEKPFLELTPEDLEDNRRSAEAAEAVETFMKFNKWAVRTMPIGFRGKNLPKDVLKITVGFKPMLYFAPQWAKDLDVKMKELDRKRRERSGKPPLPEY